MLVNNILWPIAILGSDNSMLWMVDSCFLIIRVQIEKVNALFSSKKENLSESWIRISLLDFFLVYRTSGDPDPCACVE